MHKDKWKFFRYLKFLAQPKVWNHCSDFSFLAGHRDEDVMRLDVPMNNVQVVQMLNTLSRLTQNGQGIKSCVHIPQKKIRTLNVWNQSFPEIQTFDCFVFRPMCLKLVNMFGFQALHKSIKIHKFWRNMCLKTAHWISSKSKQTKK